MKQQLNDLAQWLIKYKIVEEDTDSESLLSLKRLDLSGHKFEYIPNEIGLLKNLIVLNLSNNRLESLPETISNLTSLMNLDLRRNKLNTITPLSPLNLRSLNVSFNRIRSLEALKQMNELRALDVSANELVNINHVVASLKELRQLNASYNYLEQFDVTSIIETLNLSQNNLYTVTAHESSALQRVDLSGNSLDTIPTFLSNSSIEKVDLSSNKLSHLHLKGMMDLESIILDNNFLISITYDRNFAPNLNELSCAGCSIKELRLPQSKSLKVIDFSSNLIESMEDTIFENYNLEEIDLSNNKLNHLPSSIGKIASLSTLYIENNPLEVFAVNEIMSWHIKECYINIESPIIIEKANENDLQMMAELLAQLFTIENDFDIDFDKQKIGLSLVLNEPYADLYVAKSDKQIVGMVTMQRVISTAEGGYSGLIEDLIVDAQYREMKIGTRLIRKMIQIASQKGYCRIQLAADKDNQNGLTFYRQRGFKQTNLTVFHFIDLKDD